MIASLIETAPIKASTPAIAVRSMLGGATGALAPARLGLARSASSSFCLVSRSSSVVASSLSTDSFSARFASSTAACASASLLASSCFSVRAAASVFCASAKPAFASSCAFFWLSSRAFAEAASSSAASRSRSASSEASAPLPSFFSISRARVSALLTRVRSPARSASKEWIARCSQSGACGVSLASTSLIVLRQPSWLSSPDQPISFTAWWV